MDIFGILDPDQHKNLCELNFYSTGTFKSGSIGLEAGAEKRKKVEPDSKINMFDFPVPNTTLSATVSRCNFH